jgi:guanosine-3',5'-bis(diphosphate) 3'-pyrophosphohydrolase
MEVSDDKTRVKKERKRLQIEGAPGLSRAAQLIRISDKCCNIRDMAESPPADWSVAWQLNYLDWAEQVVRALEGAHPGLESCFKTLCAEVRAHLQA